ncbi:MAG: hypothetical protein KIS88_10035 [Anaerolineales bacterium]|nr:hypothetical protein [Anaerolineales bacterium]
MLATACGQATPESTPVAEVTATPEGPLSLNICMGSEPSSLYIYADNSSSAQAVRQAIYDGPFEWHNFVAEGVLFDSQPQPSVQAVTVRQGDLVVDAYGHVVALAPGARVRPAGCQDGNCALLYSEGELQMDQVSTTFTLKPGLVWADGTPLSANDSLFSYQVASDPATPSNKDLIAKTASYAAADERTIVWVGLPGFVDPQAASRFWHPLPQHTLGGMPAVDLLTDEQAARSPLGWGAYSVTQWVAGERIQLTRNSHYAGQPGKFAELNFLFIGTEASAAALTSGRCDLVLPSAGLTSFDPASMQGSQVAQDQWLQLVFGVRPQSYEDGFNVYADRPDYFGDAAMRTALAQCIDRQSIASALNAAPAISYLPNSSPYANAESSLPAYDPAAANASLDALGWITSEDGIRRSQSFAGAIFGQAFEVRLAVSDDAQELAVAQQVLANLADCGVLASIESLPAEELFATGPQSTVFGRNFDLALFAWPYGELPACYLFLGEAVPGANWNTSRYGWGGWNVSGWQNAEFDAACHTALNTLASDPAYSQAQQTAHSIFTQQLPVLPLAAPYSVVAARADFCGLENLDAGERLLQNIERYGYGSLCP